MSLLQTALEAAWRALATAAPWVLLGLAVAGALHVLLPPGLVRRWLGRPGLSGVVRGAWLGLPLPLCSCSVLPVTLEMRRQGATRPASLSFLITTPESSVDSVLLTGGLLGPVMAIARPVAAFFSALLAGALSIAYERDDSPPRHSCDASPDPGDRCAHHHHPGQDHGHDHEHALDDAADSGYAEARRDLWAWLRGLPRRLAGPPDPAAPPPPQAWRRLARPALRYGFGELADDVLGWLLLGVLAAGLVTALLPAAWLAGGAGAGLPAMLVLLLVGIPMYVCASASTPIAAALVAKGVSPGAALVFLLAGPATNLATILALGRHFGTRFVKIYLGAVAVGALLSGLALDALLGFFGGQVAARVAEELTTGPTGFELGSLAVLAAVVVGRWRTGAAGRLLADFRREGRALGELLAPADANDPRGPWRRLAPRIGRLGAAVALTGYLATGFERVETGSRGYGLVLGALVAPDLPPGLHWLPPRPFGRFDVWRVDHPRKTDLGFRTDLELIRRRRELTLFADPRGWHSPVAAMNPQPEEASYLTADENLLEMSFTVHYTVSDPLAFFYGTSKDVDVVALVAEATARELVAATTIDALLTASRGEFERTLAARLGERLDRLRAGVRVDSVRVVDLHPPAEAVAAFRDVSSAREERETRIHRARELEASEVPRARGQAALERARALAAAESASTLATGRARGFLAQARAFGRAKVLLRHQLWTESAERALAGKEKFVVPAGTAPGSGVTLWRDREPAAPAPPSKR